MSHPVLEVTADLGANVSAMFSNLINVGHGFSLVGDWSVETLALYVLALNTRALILLLGCLLVLKFAKGSAANRHLLLFSALCALLLLPLVTQLVPSISIELEAIQESLPILSESVTDYIAPITISNEVNSLNIYEIGFIGYVTIAAIILAKIAWENLLVFILFKISPAIKDSQWNSILQQQKITLGICKPIAIFSSKHIASPLTWGNRKPVIIIPESARRWPQHVVRSALLHELAHIRRRDWLAQQVARVICACFWMNPLCWLTFKKLSTYAEVACDDIALRSGIRNSHYANDLLNVAKQATSELFSLATLSMAAPMGTSELSQRVKAILKPGQARHPNSFLQIFCIWLVVSGLILPFSSLRASFVQIIENNNAVQVPSAHIDTAADPYLSHRISFPNMVIQPPQYRRVEIPVDLTSLRATFTRELEKRLALIRSNPQDSLAHDLAQNIAAQETQEPPQAKAKAVAEKSAPEIAATSQELSSVSPVDDPVFGHYGRYLENTDQSAELNYLNQMTSRAQPLPPAPVVENYVRKKMVLPRYPRVAEQRGLQGEVVVEFSIDEFGNVLNPEIVSNDTSDMFNNSVLRAIKQFSFEPQKINGTPVAVDNVREVFVFVIEA